MKDDQKREQSQPQKDGNETPKIYAIKRQDGKWMLTRKSFLEAVSTAVGGAALGGLGAPSTLSAADRNTTSGTGGRVVYAHAKPVMCLAISPDGKWLASGGEEGNLKLWALPQGALVKSVDGTSPLDAVTFSSGGTLLVSGSRSSLRGSIKLWKLPELKEEKVLRETTGDLIPLHLATSPNNANLASGGADGKMRLWSLPDGKLLSDSKVGQHATVLKVSFSADGKSLLKMDGSDKISVLSIPEFAVERQIPLPRPSPAPSEKPQAVRSDLEQRAAKGDAEAQYRLGSEFAKGNSRQLDKVEAYKWLRLAVENGCKDASPLRAKVGASLSPDEMREAMRRSRLVTGGEPDLGPSSASGFVCFLVVTGGQTVIAGRKSGNIELISYATGEILKSLMGHTETLQALAITPDGKLLASAGDDKSIKLWSVPGGELLKTLTGHAKKINALAISPDGKLLASGSEDKTIRLWALPDGKELFCLMDLEANYKTAEGITYKSENQFGQVVTYTLPCGSPIPPGAVCVCNCVPGSLTMPTGHTQQFAGTVCTCDLICTCNTVCTCQSVGRGSGGYSYYVSYWYPN